MIRRGTSQGNITAITIRHVRVEEGRRGVTGGEGEGVRVWDGEEGNEVGKEAGNVVGLSSNMTPASPRK